MAVVPEADATTAAACAPVLVRTWALGTAGSVTSNSAVPTTGADEAKCVTFAAATTLADAAVASVDAATASPPCAFAAAAAAVGAVVVAAAATAAAASEPVDAGQPPPNTTCNSSLRPTPTPSKRSCTVAPPGGATANWPRRRRRVGETRRTVGAVTLAVDGMAWAADAATVTTSSPARPM